MTNKMITLALVSLSCFAAPAFAGPANGIVAVTVSKDDIAMASLQGIPGADCGKPDDAGKGTACTLSPVDNPDWFRGVNLCVSRLDENWAIRRDGSLITDDPLRRASCTPFNGSAPARSAGTVPFFEKGGRIVAWQG